MNEDAKESKWFVILPWSEYHELSSTPLRAAIVRTHKAASDLAESYLDKVYGPLPHEAATELVTAFRDLCWADWSPNQTPEDRDENYIISSNANIIIKTFEEAMQ